MIRAKFRDFQVTYRGESGSLYTEVNQWLGHFDHVINVIQTVSVDPLAKPGYPADIQLFITVMYEEIP